MTKRRPTVDPLVVWTDLATRSSEMLRASGEVIALRSQRMASSGAMPSAADRREIQRMVDEKLSAARESMLAMSTRAAQLVTGSTMQWFGDIARQSAWMFGIAAPVAADPATTVSDAVGQIASAGLAPYHRRATGNVKRLRKQK